MTLDGNDKADKIDEEFTHARIFISKMKSEIKALTQKHNQLEMNQQDRDKSMEKLEKDLGEYKIQLQQVFIAI